MKLTVAKKEWVLNRVKHYSDLFCIAPPPKVIMTMAEYNRKKEELRERYTRHIRVGRSNPWLLGVCHRKDGFIVILVKRHKNTAHIDHTIRHEMLHFCKPSYNHCSAIFQDRMERLKQGKLKNGRFYK